MIVAFSVGWICPFCYSSCLTLISSKIHVIAGDGFAAHFGGHDRAFTSWYSLILFCFCRVLFLVPKIFIIVRFSFCLSFLGVFWFFKQHERGGRKSAVLIHQPRNNYNNKQQQQQQ